MKFAVIAAVVFLQGVLLANSPSRPKNLILVIGDGLGPSQVELLRDYLRTHDPKIPVAFDALAQNGQSALISSNPAISLVADSASGATQIGTGVLTRPGIVGMDSQGQSIQNILERMKADGKSIGVISNTMLNDATPASFTSHQISRKFYDKITLEQVRSKFDVMLSGGLEFYLPRAVNHKNSSQYHHYRKEIPSQLELSSRRRDNYDALGLAKRNGFELVFSKSQLAAARGKKILGLFSRSYMPSAMPNDNTLKEKKDIPSLREMTKEALKRLVANGKGFGLVVEEGQTDLAAHSNDASYMLRQLLNVNQVLLDVLDFAKEDQQTLVVFAADHDTGGFSFSYRQRQHPVEIPIAGQIYRQKYDYGDPRAIGQLMKQERTCSQIIIKLFEKRPSVKEVIETLRRDFQIEADQQLVDKLFKLEVKSFLQDSELRQYRRSTAHSRCAVLARAQAKDLPFLFSTGFHTSLPTAAFAYYPHGLQVVFSGYYGSHILGQKIWQAMGYRK